MRWILQWSIAFCFTQLVEMGVYVQAPAPLGDGTRRPIGERLAIAFAASAITHPMVWFVIPEVGMTALGITEWWHVVAIAEVFAWLTEALYLRAFGVRWAILWSLLANGTSFVGGLFCYEALDW